MDYREKFVVEPGASVKLADFDPGFKSKHDPKKDALSEIQDCVQQLDELQYKMWAEHRHSLLIVLQGLDAAGKDGVVRHVLSGMNPESCRVASFKKPTADELDHDFLWRVHPHAPARGTVAIFNRSHYEDVLVVRVHNLVAKKVWSKRYDLINDFERSLYVENGTTIVKFFLHISKEEQLARFAQRLDDPLRQWKISDSDYSERDYWDDYTAAFEDVLANTSTKHAPWLVIPSNHKWFRNLAISHILVETMKGMDLQLPKVTVDLAKIREEFHRATETEAVSRDD
jgi:PPK2 family polyphosphate:nucleotide phosphotransferase